MKKSISLILCFLLTVSFLVFPVYAESPQISLEEMKETLISQGLFSSYVNSLSNLQIEDLYNKIQTGKSEIKIVQEYALMDNNEDSTSNYGLIDEDNFMLAVGIIVDYETDGRIDKAAGLVMWQWVDGHPGGRRDDLVHIFWVDACFTVPTTNFGSADYYYTHFGEQIVYNEKTSPAIIKTNEMLVYTDVYSGFGVDRGGWCVFEMNPAKPMYKGDDYSTPLTVTYYHNKSLVPYVNNFTYTDSASGLTIGFIDAFTDTLGKSLSFEYS
ncbi:MAG: hypothetical protein IKB36_04205 [Clostridia bacterium]|nr:hypothetical protein [Clostridia bacterium]